MSKISRAQEHPEEQLRDELKHVRSGMLGIQGSHSHMQPMSQFIDHENSRLWFFTGRDTDLFKELEAGKHAHFCIISKKQDYHACIMGKLFENKDQAKIEEFWNDAVGAWFNGKDDPNMTLLQFDLMDAAIWASTQNPIKFAWEIERAKDSPREPDVGARAAVQFS